MTLRQSKRQSYEQLREYASRQEGYVYLMHCTRTGFSKIGWSLKPPIERLQEIRREFRNGFDWQLVEYMRCFNPPGLEAAMHRWLDYARVTDKREWFVLDDADTWAIQMLFMTANPGLEMRDVKVAAWRIGYREGIEAGRHLEQLDVLDVLEWDQQVVGQETA